MWELYRDSLYSAEYRRGQKWEESEHSAKFSNSGNVFDGFCLTKPEKSITLYGYVARRVNVLKLSKSVGCKVKQYQR